MQDKIGKLFVVVLILLLTVSVDAQENRFTKQFQDLDKLMSVSDTGYKVNPNHNNLQGFFYSKTTITVDDWTEYKRLCYNDSTLEVIKLSKRTFYNKWIHKTPTPTDFLNWLEINKK